MYDICITAHDEKSAVALGMLFEKNRIHYRVEQGRDKHGRYESDSRFYMTVGCLDGVALLFKLFS